MKLTRPKRRIQSQLDMTPLIDVVLLLLIFFLLSSSMITQSGIKINLPKVKNAKVGDINRLEIKITSDNHIFVNNQQVAFEALDPILNDAAKAKKMVMIRGDERASLGEIVRIWDLCKSANITKLNIAAEVR